MKPQLFSVPFIINSSTTLVQKAIKILTLGFFISMITGFVIYRSGYFDSTKTSYALQTSPNGGELNSTQIDQDSTKSPEIEQNTNAPVMPSSKSLAPVFDLDGESVIQDMKKEILPSSKSLLHPIEIKPDEWKLDDIHLYSSKSMTYPIEVGQTANQIEDKKREAFRKQPELEPSDSSSVNTDDSDESSDATIKKTKRKSAPETKSTPINWRGIWIGVLGILFVAIGSIVYFKRRSK
jgi:hypothetical protein